MHKIVVEHIFRAKQWNYWSYDLISFTVVYENRELLVLNIKSSS